MMLFSVKPLCQMEKKIIQGVKIKLNIIKEICLIHEITVMSVAMKRFLAQLTVLFFCFMLMKL